MVATIDQVFEQVSGLFQRRKIDKARDYTGLVRLLATDGKPPKPERVAEILDVAERTPDQLRADVELLRNRIVWRARLDAEPGQSARSDAINGEIEQLRARHREASLKLDAELTAAEAPLRAEREKLQGEISRTGFLQCRDHLIETAAGYSEAKKLWGAFPDRANGDRLRKELQIAQHDLRQAEAVLIDIEKSNSRKNPLVESRLLTGPAEKEIAIAKQKIESIEKELAADAAAWASHRERAKAAELALLEPENYQPAA